MAIKEVHGPKGSMILNHDWNEDSQGISEYYNKCVNLEADSNNETFVLMTIENGKADSRKGLRQSKTIFKISALELISLIEQHGSVVKL